MAVGRSRIAFLVVGLSVWWCGLGTHARRLSFFPPESGNSDFLSVIDQFSDDAADFRDAVRNSDLKTMKRLFDCGCVTIVGLTAFIIVDGQSMTGTVLHDAANIGDPEVVQFLLDAGMGMEKRTSAGFTPLHIASWGGHEEVVQVLIDAGANIDGASTDVLRRTALHYAAVRNRVEVVKLLVDAGANMEKKSGLGLTPLVSALGFGSEGSARVLLDSGADLSAPGYNGRNAQDSICACRDESACLPGRCSAAANKSMEDLVKERISGGEVAKMPKGKMTRNPSGKKKSGKRKLKRKRRMEQKKKSKKSGNKKGKRNGEVSPIERLQMIVVSLEDSGSPMEENAVGEPGEMTSGG